MRPLSIHNVFVRNARSHGCVSVHMVCGIIIIRQENAQLNKRPFTTLLSQYMQLYSAYLGPRLVDEDD